jgi:FlaA1/EpsC-like NDP-sugar epimerase
MAPPLRRRAAATALPPRLAATLADLAAGAAAWPVALLLAAPWDMPGPALLAALSLLSGAGFVLAGLAFGLPRQDWHLAGLAEVPAIAAAGALAAALVAVAAPALAGWTPTNPATPLLHGLMLALLPGGARLLVRLSRAAAGPHAPESLPVLLAGAPEAADLVLRALDAAPAALRPRLRPVGLLARNPRHVGRQLRGVPVLGTLAGAEAVLAALAGPGEPVMIVVADPDLSGELLGPLADVAARRGIPLRRAPHPAELTDARDPPALREVPIEELLDRPQRRADRARLARMVGGRRVLVTGAGGTIGGELARQVAALGPAELILLDHAEAALYEAELDLSERHPALPRRAVLADIRDAPRIRALLHRLRPELVFHAAALKHVPMVERDPCEGLLTNAEGTRIVADAAAEAGAQAMVLISTDKAVNPASVMGASKRLAELYAQALDRQARRAGGMRVITVRFGNVLGSTGSVVPLFRRQLARGGPLTVTHPEMRRYFMTVREAVGLVLEATVVGADPAGEGPPGLAEGGIFVLDMGRPVRILDLARRMIRLSGREPGRDVAIRFTGLRPGEKLAEELFHGAEPPRPTRFPGLLMATPRTAEPEAARSALDRVAAAARAGDAPAALAALSEAVPEYRAGGDRG